VIHPAIVVPAARRDKGPDATSPSPNAPALLRLAGMPAVVAAWTKVIVDYAAAHGVDVTRPDVDLSRMQRGLSMGDIAEHLGFSEARAFRRWTGLVPSAIAGPA
jgi:hypothetical protein